MSRILFVEPNLQDAGGHPFEFARALCQSSARQGLQPILACGREAIHIPMPTTGRVLPVLSLRTFGHLDDQGERLCTNLKDINESIVFSENDVVVVLTGHLNEVVGIRKFVGSTNVQRCPRFFVLVHQLYPPEDNFLDACRQERRRVWLHRWQAALAAMDPRITICATPSKKLQRLLASYVGKAILELPLPFDVLPKPTNRKGVLDVKSRYRGAFLGDGRYEKGLQLLLEAIGTGDGRAKIIIQNAKLRGFSQADASRVLGLLRSFAERDRIILVPPAMPRDRFCELLCEIDFLVLPYHPYSYDARVSALLVQSVLMEKPAVVSSGTWLGDEVQKHSAGVQFTYDVQDRSGTVLSLQRAISKLIDDFDTYRAAAARTAATYAAFHNPLTFLNTILENR